MTTFKIESPDYVEYSDGYMWTVYIGDKTISAEINFPVKPTKKQLRQLMKAWKKEVNFKDFKSLWHKRYDIKKGEFA